MRAGVNSEKHTNKEKTRAKTKTKRGKKNSVQYTLERENNGQDCQQAMQVK